MVEKIQLAVINYYGQYDAPDQSAEQGVEQDSEQSSDAAGEPEAAVAGEVLAEAPESIEIESDKMETPGSGGDESAEAGGLPEEPVH